VAADVLNDLLANEGDCHLADLHKVPWEGLAASEQHCQQLLVGLANVVLDEVDSQLAWRAEGRVLLGFFNLS